MSAQLTELVVEFYSALFDRIFSVRFRADIAQPIKRREVLRRVEEAADAASQSLTRLFVNEKVTKSKATQILKGLGKLQSILTLQRISTSDVSTDGLVEELLPGVSPPGALKAEADRTLYRVSLHTILQVLLLVGPVMAEWRKLRFSSTYEMPRRVINRLNEISSRFGGTGSPAADRAADRAYEETYRDYILTRFHQTGVGTVKMTTQMDVDIRELFVMPRAMVQSAGRSVSEAAVGSASDFLDLIRARELLRHSGDQQPGAEAGGIPLLHHVRRYPRNVLIGTPGSGKSTFLEWLQLQLAFVEVELVLGGEQAIPLVVRVRSLNPEQPPHGQALLEHALGSKDRAALAPNRWLERQMEAGRVFVMLDGLDEIEPELRDKHLVPWVTGLCKQYPQCRYIVSSRPVGYSPGALGALEFQECTLLDFDKQQVGEYAKHWCTAVRLARNELEEEARREGQADGAKIVGSFEANPYVRDLARNPLMLSAICLVNYFDNGTLPDDRAVLYAMCVEGLLHNWDHRRGIRSEFGLEEKLRVCRELALVMQAANRAEYESDKVYQVFADVLGDPARAGKLLEHIRYRTGLLVERRNGVYAFAHLTFQEYLAALAILRGNRQGTVREQIVREHDDGRWREVIPLHCGMSETAEARGVIEELMQQPDSASIGSILTESFFASAQAIASNVGLRRRVIRRVALAPFSDPAPLKRFYDSEVLPIANESLGSSLYDRRVSNAFTWFQANSISPDESRLDTLLNKFTEISPLQLWEFVYFVHRFGSDPLLEKTAQTPELYRAAAPQFWEATIQGEMALYGLSERAKKSTQAFDCALRAIVDVLLERQEFGASPLPAAVQRFASEMFIPEDLELRSKLKRLVLSAGGLTSYPGFMKWADALGPPDAQVAQPNRKLSRAKKRELENV